jgi:trk system potassium uptake protein TrkA
MVAATGDDKSNLVISLLSKTEFGVPRVVARVNNPKNEWMFDSAWGVDVPVSTPRVMTALVEEAVSVGALVRLFEFHEAQTAIYAITLPADSAAAGKAVSSLKLPGDAKILTVLRDDAPLDNQTDFELEAGDELVLMLASSESSLHQDIEELFGSRG